ncbi:MAG: TIGR00341 family protein, partial [Chloroflexota bacterium]
MSEEKAREPLYFRRIIVPVSKPDIAAQMLELASLLVDPEDGQIFAVTVGTAEEGEAVSERLETLEPIVEQFEQATMITQIASSATRGILEAAREQGAEMLIMGVHRSNRREEVQLGSIVENVVQAAPCNILIFRTDERTDFNRVVVPLDDTILTQPPLEIATTLALSQGAKISTPYIQRDYSSTREKEKHIQSILSVLDEDQHEGREFVTGRTPGDSLVNAVTERDILVLGFSQRADLDLEFGRDVSDVLLRRARCPVLLYSQILEERDTMTGFVQRILQRFNPALTQVERNELVWSARKQALSSIDFNWLIMMSAGLATLGLMLNSVAVIIGAMLVAPLMSPLGALAVGLAVGELSITRRAAITVLQGFLLALLISIVFGMLLPLQTPTSEMLSRGSPSFLDAAVALVSGLVAAFALARKEIPVALAGVAIAAALMPPICTIGLGIALGRPELAMGATLLFVTNITFIVASENIIFLWMGLRPGRRQDTQREVVVWWSLITTLLIVTGVAIFRLGQEATANIEVEDVLIAQLPAAEFVSIDERLREDGTLSVLFTVRSP